jgi:hypothetical protein
MDSFKIEVTDSQTAEAVRREAEAHGRTVQDELGALVERTYGPATKKDWIDELIEMTRPGAELVLPPRALTSDPPAFAYDDFN